VLPDPVLRWVTHVTGATPVGSRELPGATSSSVSVVDFAHGHQLVLRLHTNDAWLADEPDLATREAVALRALAGTSVVAPRLIAVDESGEFCGRPAVLMSKLPGESDPTVGSVDRLRLLASALPALHEQPIPDGLSLFAPYQQPEARKIPTWTSMPEVWRAAIDVCASPPPSGPIAFIHRDYHPGNVLFSGGRRTGIVDWVNACAGPPEIDIAHCRLNLALRHGLAVADEFAAIAMTDAIDADPARQAYWELVDCLDLGASGDVASRTDEYLAASLRRWHA
jgi:aminoglycoside phosphotransferase (APT) family kinase protein